MTVDSSAVGWWISSVSSAFCAWCVACSVCGVLRVVVSLCSDIMKLFALSLSLMNSFASVP